MVCVIQTLPKAFGGKGLVCDHPKASSNYTSIPLEVGGVGVYDSKGDRLRGLKCHENNPHCISA